MKFPHPWHGEPHESLLNCGPAASWRRLQHLEFLEPQQPPPLAGEAAHIENAEGLTHSSSTHIAATRAPRRRKIRERLGVCELTLFTATSNLPRKYRKQPPVNY